MSVGRDALVAQSDRLQEAAEWWVTLQETSESELPQAVAEAWSRWSADPENRRVMTQLSTLHTQMKTLPRPLDRDARELDRDRYTGAVAVAQWRALVPSRGYVSRHFWSIAASVILTVGLAGFAVVHRNAMDWFPIQKTYVTRASEHRAIVLPDGSTVDLGARTALTTIYTSHRRTIVLSQGVAIFNVAHNAIRPFIVETGHGSITAVGTTFQVLHDGHRTVVTVTEGAVVVEPRFLGNSGNRDLSREVVRSPFWQPARVSHGQEITIDATGAAPVVTPANLVVATAWREGRLQYLGEHLRNVIADVNRYSRRQITCQGASCDLLYTGTVFEQDVDAWIDGLPLIFGVKLTESDSKHVTLTSLNRIDQ